MAETPARFCSNCGQELSNDARFCSSCGRPVHETAHVPTPEADRPVPRTPPAAERSAWQRFMYGTVDAPQAPQAETPQEGLGQRHPILTGCLVVVGALVLLIIVAAALGGGDETAGGADAGGQQAQEEPVQPEEQPKEGRGQDQGGGQDQQQRDEGQQPKQGPASIGEEVVVGDAAYTVTNARPETRLADPDGFSDPLEGNFIVVDFTVENRGDDPMSVSDIGLYVYDAQDREFETESDVPSGYIPEDRDLFLIDRLNPGLSQNVRVVFSIPPDAQGFEMEVSSGGFFDTETRRITLGL